jgi:rubrerythrin
MNPRVKVDFLESTMKKEMETIIEYNRLADSSEDFETRRLFRSLASQKYEYYLFLEKHLKQIRANNDITDAINSMFQ